MSPRRWRSQPSPRHRRTRRSTSSPRRGRPLGPRVRREGIPTDEACRLRGSAASPPRAPGPRRRSRALEVLSPRVATTSRLVAPVQARSGRCRTRARLAGPCARLARTRARLSRSGTGLTGACPGSGLGSRRVRGPGAIAGRPSALTVAALPAVLPPPVHVAVRARVDVVARRRSGPIGADTIGGRGARGISRPVRRPVVDVVAGVRRPRPRAVAGPVAGPCSRPVAGMPPTVIAGSVSTIAHRAPPPRVRSVIR
jgi:hypothetical protein